MNECDLGLNECRFLEAYRRFYGEPYPAVRNDNQNAHVKGQKMIYLLALKGVSVGDYGFTWQQHGPCSDALQKMMRRLDKVPKAVKGFYSKFSLESGSDKSLYSDDSNSQRLFRYKDAERIDAFREALEIPTENGDKDLHGDTVTRRWMELLGSLTYISITRLPGADEGRIWEELECAKSKAKYVDAPEKDQALRVLREAILLSCV